MEDIEDCATKIRSPRTNGFVERMNRTFLAECFRMKGRQTYPATPRTVSKASLNATLRFRVFSRLRFFYFKAG